MIEILEIYFAQFYVFFFTIYITLFAIGYFTRMLSR